MVDLPTSRPVVRLPRITELNEEMSDLHLAPTVKKKDSRKGRRGGKGKSSTGKEKVESVLVEEGDEYNNEVSSKTVSEGAINTDPLDEPYQPRTLPQFPAQSVTSTPYIYVPMLPHYEIRTVPSATAAASTTSASRIEQNGLFATQAIEAGTRIICEPPIITLPAPSDQLYQLMQAYYALPAHKQDRIWTLNPAPASASEMLSFMGTQIMEKIHLLVAIKSKPDNVRTAKEAALLADLLPKVAEASDWYRIAARWHTNRCSLTNLVESQRAYLPPGTPITGLFVDTVRLRHSCVPNCYAHYNPLLNRMTVHVTAPVAPGTELTLSFLSSGFHSSVAHRALEFQKKFCIKCDCAACTPTHAQFKQHETARTAANGRALILLHYLTQLSIIESDTALANLHLTPLDRSIPPTLDELNDAERTTCSLITNLKTMGCTGPELIRWLNALVDRIQPRLANVDELSDGETLTWWRFVLRHVKEAGEVGLKCFGADEKVVREMGERSKRLDGLVDKVEKEMGGQAVRRREEFVRRNIK